MPSHRAPQAINRPNLHYESAYKGRVCGVDEAGRGPLAGPVVAAAVILSPKTDISGLDDSKRLSPAKRERALNAILQNCQVGIGMAEPCEIDRVNILAASMIAMQRAVASLPDAPDAALIDGNRAPALPCQTLTIIKGDSKSLSIAAASIVAKVTRDRIMQSADLRYPGYGFAQNKGYPTAAHRARLIQAGPCSIHRYGFAPVAQQVLV